MNEREEAKQSNIYVVGVYKKQGRGESVSGDRCQSNPHFYFTNSLRNTVTKFTLRYREVGS